MILVSRSCDEVGIKDAATIDGKIFQITVLEVMEDGQTILAMEWQADG